MSNRLILTALGDDRPDLAEELCRAVLDCGCNVADARMVVLGGAFAVTLMVGGNWNTLAKLEVQCRRLEQALGATILARRTEGRLRSEDALPYAVEVIAIDRSGIIFHLTEFFAKRGVWIEELTGRNYRAPHTGSPMFSVNMAIGIPADTHIAVLRDEFMEFCDRHNMDAVMEPIKG